MPDGGSTVNTDSFHYDPSQYITAATDWANTQAGRGDQTFNWANDQFNKNAGTSDNVIKTALANGTMFDNAAGAGVSRYENMYAPAMQQQLDFAKNYATPENLALYRGQAMSGVGQAFDAQAKASSDSLRSYGLDPGAISSRLDSSVRTQRAVAEAGAGTQSDINAKLVGQQLLGQAINTGQADAGITNAFGASGAAARNQAVNTGLATTASGSATMGSPLSWASMGNTELQQWPTATLAGLSAQNQYGALQNQINSTNNAYSLAQNQQGSGWGALAGAFLGGAGNMMGGGGSGNIMKMIGGLGGSSGGAGGAGGGSGTISNVSSPGLYSGSIGSDGLGTLGAGSPGYAEGGVVRKFALGGDAGDASSGGGVPYLSMATDAYGIANEAANGDQGQTPMPATPYDPLGSVWNSLSGSTPTEDEGGRIGHQIGYEAGDVASTIFPMAAPLFREGFGRLGSGVGEMVQGNFGKGLQNLASGTPLSFVFHARGGPVTPQVTGQNTPGGLPASAPPPGGAIRTGPIVPPQASVPGIHGPDKVPAMVQAGEGIVPKPIMQFIGHQGFQAFLDKQYKAMGMGPQPPAQGKPGQVPPQAVRTGPTFASQGAVG